MRTYRYIGGVFNMYKNTERRTYMKEYVVPEVEYNEFVTDKKFIDFVGGAESNTFSEDGDWV